MMTRLVTMVAFVVTCAAATPAFAQQSADGFFTTSDGVKIHYLTIGSSGSWVVLIHGYSDTAQRMWFTTGIAPVFARNHRVVALDNRNHGQSDKPQPGGAGRAQDVVELMDHLKIEKAHIHGYSMGGALTGQLLAMIPGRFITAGGERVIVAGQAQCGVCYNCLRGRADHCLMGNAGGNPNRPVAEMRDGTKVAGFRGGCAELMVTFEDYCVPVVTNVSSIELAMLHDVGMVGLASYTMGVSRSSAH